MPVSLYSLECPSSWASRASCSQTSDGGDGLGEVQENSARVPPEHRERAKVQKPHQCYGHCQVRCCSTSAHWGRTAADSRSTFHRWVEKALMAEMTPKLCPSWTAEGNPSALVHATRREKHQSSRARSDGQRYPDEILGQVAFVGCCAKPAELSRPAEPGPRQRDGSARIKSIIKQGLQIASRSPIIPWSP